MREYEKRYPSDDIAHPWFGSYYSTLCCCRSMRSDLGSPALAKVREAVMGPNGNNLDDLVRLDGITLKPLISMDFHISAFLHTGDLEAVNALLLKYLPKKIAFRFVKIRESLTCTALLRSDTDIQTFLFIQIQSTAFLPLGFAPPWLPWTTTWTLTGNSRSVLSMAWHCITEQSK